jgi:hypothetical protein
MASTAPLTNDEIELCMIHLSYQRNTGVTQNLGGTVANELLFLAYTRLQALLPGVACDKVRQILGYLEGLWVLKYGASARLAVDEVGEIKIRQREIAQINSQYRDWQSKLSAITGAPVNVTGDFSYGRGLNVPTG